jgi:quercetin dioxygenase-like cupin family protein
MGEQEAKPLRSAWAGEVGGLADMVQYQKGSVVSRALVSKKAGTVTLFAFDKDQALSEHTAPYDALVHLLDGAAEVTISGKPFNLRQGEAILMPAGEPHALKATKSFKMVLTMIKSE